MYEYIVMNIYGKIKFCVKTKNYQKMLSIKVISFSFFKLTLVVDRFLSKDILDIHASNLKIKFHKINLDNFCSRLLHSGIDKHGYYIKNTDACIKMLNSLSS